MTYRMERITRLLKELQYEVTRGTMGGEVDPFIDFRFDFPRKGKHIIGRFHTKEVESCDLEPITPQPILKSV